MKGISAYRGYRAFYEVGNACLVVYVYLDKQEYERAFGFTLNNTDEAEVEYQFRLSVDSYISKRPRIYQDLKSRFADRARQPISNYA